MVQVVEQQVSGEEPVHSHLSEAQLTDRLIHPNIVITHKTISRTRTVRLTCKVMALRPGPITLACTLVCPCICWNLGHYQSLVLGLCFRMDAFFCCVDSNSLSTF